MARSPAVPYIAPFAALLALLGLNLLWPLTGAAGQLAWIAAVSAAVWLVARPVLDFRVRNWAGTLIVGALICGVWIAPDLISPRYRHSWLFDNPVVGSAHGSLPAEERRDPLVLVLRTLRASVLAPIAEELFWRGWLMRRMIAPDFQKVALGSYTAASFWTVALLFASEHGPYWDVGLAAGIVFNLWIVRTKSLGDLILAHAVANLCLSLYVIAEGKWEYWM